MPKGHTNNLKGRPKAGLAYIEQLRGALKKVEEEKGKPFLEEVCNKAYHDKNIMIALLKKLIPDLSQLDLESQKGLLIRIVENFQPKKDESDNSTDSDR